jgi:hypothetical protein
VKIRYIRERHAGLALMQGRALPSPTAENKVSFLLADRFQRQYEVSEQRRKKLITIDHPCPEDELPVAIAEARDKAWEAILDEDLPIKKIPEHMRLTKEDMPKAMKGEEGWKNGAGIAEIRRLLGPLYKKTGDEVTEGADTTELEPDELPPAENNPMAEHIAAS